MNTLPNRKPNRLAHYDYATNGVYFITICTKDRQQILSRIVGAATCRPDASSYTTEYGEPLPCRVVLSEWGMIVDAAIREIPSHYANVTVDRYVIMPNHVHLLLRIKQTSGRQVAAPTVIGSFKRYVSIAIGRPIWQKGFYDHVIRGEEDCLLHCRYIDENPWKWFLGEDEYP